MSSFSTGGGGGLSLDGYSDETENRSFNTEYQNTSGNALLVQVTDEDGSYGGRPTFSVGSVSGSLTETFPIEGDGDMRNGGFGIVPDGYYYSFAGRSDNTKTWFEMVLK